MLMKGKSDRVAADPEAVALAILGRIVGEPERLERFFALSGLGPDTIRSAAGEPGFLAAVLDYAASDEALLVAVAAEEGLAPEAVMAARARLSPEATFDP